MLGVSPSLCYCFWKSDPNISGADLQLVFSPASYKEGFVGMLDDYPGMSCGVWQHRPESIGYVRAKSTDIFVDPAIQPNYLSHETDQRALVGGIELRGGSCRRRAVAVHGPRDLSRRRRAHRRRDPALGRQYGGTVWHLIGTCRMGPATDKSSVVGDQLKVHGLQNLRVIDASVMPSMPSANTYSATMVIAEKGADLIRGKPCRRRWRWRASERCVGRVHRRRNPPFSRKRTARVCFANPRCGARYRICCVNTVEAGDALLDRSNNYRADLLDTLLALWRSCSISCRAGHAWPRIDRAGVLGIGIAAGSICDRL